MNDSDPALERIELRLQAIEDLLRQLVQTVDDFSASCSQVDLQVKDLLAKQWSVELGEDSQE